MSNGKGWAFLKGGFGCVLAFLAIGLIFVCLGGSMRIDVGGAILLFVIGGIVGLIVLAVYNRGRRDAVGVAPTMPEPLTPPQSPNRSGDSGTTEMHCPHCGARVNSATGEGLHSPVEDPDVPICANCGHRI